VRRAHPRPGRVAGVSLIELMVALVLGLIVTGSALTLVLTHRQTFAATEDLGRMQEGARLAFEMMGRELRGAGGNPCDSRLNVNSGLNDPEANWWTDWANLVAGVPTSTAPALRGYPSDTADAAFPFGAGIGDRVAGTDAIEVKAAVPVSADSALLTTALADPFDDDIEVNTTGDVAVGDLLLICNFNNATIFRVTSVGADTIGHGDGMADDDNAEKEMPRANTDATANFGVGAMVSKVHAARWYIGNNGVDTDGDGVADGRSLYRAMLTNNDGTLEEAVDEIAQGVVDMQVSYLVRGAVQYLDLDDAAVDFSDGSNPVVGVRVLLTLSGDDRIGPNGERVQRTMTQTVAVRGTAR